MNRSQFLASQKIGVILRVFAPKEDQVPARVQMIKEAVKQLRFYQYNCMQTISHIDVLVWADKKYGDQSDCGHTISMLREYFYTNDCVSLHEMLHGDLFCSLLNYGIAQQIRGGVDYSIIISPDAISYFNSETLIAMIDAACNGALAIGIAITELTESIKKGRIANTFAMWHNTSLMTVGGFDLRAAKPTDDRTAHYMRGWSAEKGDVYYQLAGVEEVLPLARMVDLFGPCIAPIDPKGDGVKGYVVPDQKTEPELWLRHISKMGTKLQRQEAFLNSIGYDITFLEGGVMGQYRS